MFAITPISAKTPENGQKSARYVLPHSQRAKNALSICLRKLPEYTRYQYHFLVPRRNREPFKPQKIRVYKVLCGVGGVAGGRSTAGGKEDRYLYNQDLVMADAIINTEIRDHFRFKASFLKTLMAFYKDLSKVYQASKKAKRAKAGTVYDDHFTVEFKSGLETNVAM